MIFKRGKSVLSGIIITLILVIISTIMVFFFWNYTNNEQKKMDVIIKEGKETLTQKESIDIITQSIPYSGYHESINLVKKLFENRYTFFIYNIEEYKGYSDVIFGFLPLNDPKDKEVLEELFTQRPNALFIFYYSFLLASPDGKCALPAQEFLNRYFGTHYVKAVEGDDCEGGYYGYIKISKLYIYNKEKGSYDIIYPEDPYLKMSFLEKSQDIKTNPIGVEYNSKFYPLIVDVGKRVIITSKIGVNPEIDSYIINYISNKIEALKNENG